jgi:hypothetical protein
VVPDGLDALGNILEASPVVVPDSTDFAVHDLPRVSIRSYQSWASKASTVRTNRKLGVRFNDSPDGTTIHINDNLQAHTHTEDRDLPCKVLDGIGRDTRVGLRVTRAWRNNKMLDLELREKGGVDSVVADDCDLGTRKTELLIEIPGERVKVVDHENIELSLEIGRQQRLASRHDGRGGKGDDGSSLRPANLYVGFQSVPSQSDPADRDLSG